jgi:hypothetical protein
MTSLVCARAHGVASSSKYRVALGPGAGKPWSAIVRRAFSRAPRALPSCPHLRRRPAPMHRVRGAENVLRGAENGAENVPPRFTPRTCFTLPRTCHHVSHRERATTFHTAPTPRTCHHVSHGAHRTGPLSGLLCDPAENVLLPRTCLPRTRHHVSHGCRGRVPRTRAGTTFHTGTRCGGGPPSAAKSATWCRPTS